MNSLLDPKFVQIIKSLPVADHTVAVTSKKLASYLPGSHALSRRYLLGQTPSINLLKEIVLWGYPTDKRGTATRILQPATLNTLNTVLTTGSWKDWVHFFDHFGSGKAVPSVGAVTASKIAYFYKIKLQNRDALILDSRIIGAKGYWVELSHLRFSGLTFKAVQYVAYLDAMYATAGKIGCMPDQLEFFLFTLGTAFG